MTAALIGLSATALALPQTRSQSPDVLASAPITAEPGATGEAIAPEDHASRAEREAAGAACADGTGAGGADPACVEPQGSSKPAAGSPDGAGRAGAPGATVAAGSPSAPAAAGAAGAAGAPGTPGKTGAPGTSRAAGAAGAAEAPTSSRSSASSPARESRPATSRSAVAPAPAPLRGAAAPAPGGIAWGSSVMQYGNETYDQAFSRTDRNLRPEVIRVFNGGNDGPSWPRSVAGTRPMVISFKIPTRQVLSGAYDAKLAAFFAATPRLTYWSYWHEPEDDAERGQLNRAEYRAAWRRIAGIADASGKPLRATLILMGYTAKESSRRNWTDYYPGADVIDVLAWDCYAWDPGYTPAGVYGAARAVSQKAGKPWAIAETGAGSRQFAPAQRYAMLTAMSRYLATSQPRPEFVTYFDSDPDAPRVEYGWNVSRDPAAAAAWRAGQSG